MFSIAIQPTLEEGLAMPAKSPTPLPESLRYLQPFVRTLAKLPSEELNEDVDATRLEAALRKRFRGKSSSDASALLTADVQILKTWLKADASPDHPAHWVLGYLQSPDLAEYLTRAPEPPPSWPSIAFDAPGGWKPRVVFGRLDLKKGKLFTVIMPIDESSFSHMQWQREQSATPQSRSEPPIVIQASRQTTCVEFGDCIGKKYFYLQTAPGPWKQVDYLLQVPGGHVSVGIGALDGRDFDEREMEERFHTIRIQPPARP
jgi:hypothetical protein